MKSFHLVVFGPGRAGGSIALAALRAGHDVVGLVPGPSGTVPAELAHLPITRAGLPACDILVLAVPDDALTDVVASLEGALSGVDTVAHLSGFTSNAVLAPLRSSSTAIGSLHPVQSLTDPVQGASALEGSFAAISGDERAVGTLTQFAETLGMQPFEIDDAMRALHHAAASAASNFVAAALVVSRGLAERAGVPPEAYAHLTAQTISNVATRGLGGMTGPIARGDLGTVRGQLDAVMAGAPELVRSFAAFVRATAALTPNREAIESVVGADT